MDTHKRARAHKHSHSHSHARTHARPHTQARTRTHARTRAHTHAPAHAHARTHIGSRAPPAPALTQQLRAPHLHRRVPLRFVGGAVGLRRRRRGFPHVLAGDLRVRAAGTGRHCRSTQRGPGRLRGVPGFRACPGCSGYSGYSDREASLLRAARVPREGLPHCERGAPAYSRARSPARTQPRTRASVG
jgi:hypothetical protein